MSLLSHRTPGNAECAQAESREGLQGDLGLRGKSAGVGTGTEDRKNHIVSPFRQEQQPLSLHE